MWSVTRFIRLSWRLSLLSPAGISKTAAENNFRSASHCGSIHFLHLASEIWYVSIQGCHSSETKKFPDFSLTSKIFHWPCIRWIRIKKNIHVYICFSFFCRPSIFFSSFSTSFLTFHWVLLLLRFSLTLYKIPWPWKIIVLPWFSPDRGNPDHCWELIESSNWLITRRWFNLSFRLTLPTLMIILKWQRDANENAADILKICETRNQPKINIQVKQARLILCRKINTITTW